MYLHTAEHMTEVADHSAKLLVGASVFLGKKVGWAAYEKLYRQVYVHNGLRVIRPDGVFVVIQTNAYQDGEFVCRYKLLLDLLLPAGWRLLDERVWVRRQADFFQVPFSHVLVFTPPGGTAKRAALNKTKEWFHGVWDFKQTRGGAHNAYPAGLCRLLVKAATAKGDLVVDPFAGTGALLGMAGAMGRRGVGFEIDPALVDEIRQNGVDVVDGKKRLAGSAPAGFGLGGAV